jgi:hypothetical protein
MLPVQEIADQYHVSRKTIYSSISAQEPGHYLYFLPLPHGQGLFLPIFSLRSMCVEAVKSCVTATHLTCSVSRSITRQSAGDRQRD